MKRRKTIYLEGYKLVFANKKNIKKLQKLIDNAKRTKPGIFYTGMRHAIYDYNLENKIDLYK